MDGGRDGHEYKYEYMAFIYSYSRSIRNATYWLELS